jgi:hypothetical protein
MGVNLWGENPLYDSGSLKEIIIPNGKFIFNYSLFDGSRQSIFFAKSTDLFHRRKRGPKHEFVQGDRWYEKNGRWD